MKSRSLELSWLALLLPLVAACDAEQPQVNRAPLTAAPESSEPLPPDAGPVQDASPDAVVSETGPVRRTVMRRSAYGNLQHTGNLLLDGDFEFSAAPGGTGQTPWVAFGDDGQIPLVFETGGLCRSGLRCVRLDADGALLGEAVGPSQGAMELSLWVKVPGNSCDVLIAALISRMTLSGSSMRRAQAESEMPDPAGWCRFVAVMQPNDEAVSVYIEPGPALAPWESVLVDDGVLSSVDGLSPLMWQSGEVSEDVRDRIGKRLKWLRDHRFMGVRNRESIDP